MCNLRISAVWLSCAIAFGGIWFAAAALAREWTDSTGKYKIEADFVSAENGVVTLKKSDGQTIHLPLEKLCDADRDYVKSRAAPASGDNPFAHASPAKPVTPSRSAAAVATLPLPKGVDAAAVKQAEEGMNDLFKSELAEAKTASKRVDLAKQLLQVGKDTKDDPASQFVLFRKAAELAAAGGDVETALAAVEQLESTLSLNAQPLAVESLEILSRQSKVDHRALAKAAEPLIDKALADDDFDAAGKLATIMVNSARSAKDLSQLKVATARGAEINAMREEQKKIAPAREKLQTAPEDPEANRIVGRYLCFVKRDWEHGLPLLNLGDDESLKKIANQELKENKTGGEMMALGDSWDALAHGHHATAAKERADYWYRQALPLVSGVAKIKLEKRLATASAAAGNSGLTNSIGIKLVLIPAGEFEMGENATKDTLWNDFPNLRTERLGTGLPVHHVRITKPFYMGACAVTVAQFRKFIDDERFRTEAEQQGGAEGWDDVAGTFNRRATYTWRNPGYPQGDDFPVVDICWNDAAAFCKWLSRKEKKTYRLPTRAEWEYACRAGTQTRFFFGDDPEKMPEYGNVYDASAATRLPDSIWAIQGKDGFIFAAPVGKFKPNPWGLYDMHGNVAQYCQDGAGRIVHAGDSVVDPVGVSTDDSHAVCGGSWNHSAIFGRAASALSIVPDMMLPYIGFRVVREAD